MKFEEYMITFIKLFQADETILRLLHYKANDINDDVLVPSAERPWLTPHFKEDGTPNTTYPFIGPIEYQKLRKDLIQPVDGYEDLTSTEKCRMCFYLGERRNTRNKLIARQQLTIDLYVHKNYERANFCMEKLCDYLSDKLFGKRVAGIGKVDEYMGRPIALPIVGQYHGYELIYQFGGEKW